MSDHHTSSTARRAWLITGASTGFGRAFATEALARGDRVAGTFRDENQMGAFERLAPGRAFAVRMDVTDADSVAEGVAAAEAALGCIDVLVNNAGYGLMGGVEEITDAEARRQMEVNLFGLLAVTRAVLPSMRARRAGHVVNVSSMGGVAAFPGFGVYGASKFAVEAVSEALAAEAAPLGIRVTILEPGAFRTDWAGRSMAEAAPIADYEDALGPVRAAIRDRVDGAQPGDPAKAARLLADAVAMDAPPLRLPLGGDAVEAIRAKLTAQLDDLARWEDRARATAFDDAARAA